MKPGRIATAEFLGAVALVLTIILSPVLAGSDGQALAQINDPTVEEPSPQAGNVPGAHLGTASDSEIWRAMRQGIQGTVSIPDKQAGQLIQSEGDNWRAWRNGPITVWGAWGLLIVIGLLALFSSSAAASGSIPDRAGGPSSGSTGPNASPTG